MHDLWSISYLSKEKTLNKRNEIIYETVPAFASRFAFNNAMLKTTVNETKTVLEKSFLFPYIKLRLQ